MSYDFELYMSRAVAFDPPPHTDGACHIRVDGPDRAEDEDLPSTYLPVLGKKRILFRIHLEGEMTPTDKAAVDIWLGALIAQTKGVLIDLQTERFETQAKAGYLTPQGEAAATNGWMSFFFEGGEAFYDSGFEQMLGDISQIMPEAFPARYGPYEPLQGKVEGGDASDLIRSFKTETKLFMKAKTPFGHILSSVPSKKAFEDYHPQHFIRRRFLLGWVGFELRPKIFTDPAQLGRLMALFERLCVTFDVVYGHIVQTDHMGGWFWNGLPDHEAHTICVGRAYQQVWPQITQTGHRIGNDLRVVTTDRFGNKPPRPPQSLIAPRQDLKNARAAPKLAQVFPFDYAFDENRYLW